MMGKVYGMLVMLSVTVGCLTGRMGEVSEAALDGAKDAVSLALTLVGTMSLWTALMQVLEAGGAMKIPTAAVKPLFRLLYPRVKDEESRSLLAASFSANLLGLGGAALPIAVKTVKTLQKYAPDPMAIGDETMLFCVLATVPLQLFPSSLIALRTADGAKYPFSILPCVWLAQVLSGLFAVALTKGLCALSKQKSAEVVCRDAC